jgi:CDP-ribitol ribitolphosphotransferase
VSALIVRVRTWLVRIGFRLGGVGRPSRGILLATSHAERIGGNLAFVSRDLANRHPSVNVTTLAHRARAGWRGRLGGALAAVRAGFALARARVVVVDDYYFPIYVVRPRPGTTIVQTWHASGAFKRFGHSVRDATFGADASLTTRVRIHANYDVCLVGSAAAAAHYAEAFGLPLDRFRWDLGIPRTDLFFDEARRERAVAAVRERYAIPADRRVILWAPTFRGDRVTDARDGGTLDVDLLARELGHDHLLLVRHHPFVRVGSAGPPSGFARDVSNHPDINELMLVADVLVTDYSSAIFEFSLLERPIAFLAPDLADYEAERGFYVDYRSWVPGPVLGSTADLAAWLRAGTADLDRVRRFRDASFAVADGHATERLVDEVLVPALG